MKTKHLIEVLRCPGDSFDKCRTCKVGNVCKELIHLDVQGVCAEQLEQLLTSLCHSESKLKEALCAAEYWEKAYRRLFDNINNIVEEEKVFIDYGS